jgi:hypothetical protein
MVDRTGPKSGKLKKEMSLERYLIPRYTANKPPTLIPVKTAGNVPLFQSLRIDPKKQL